MPFDAAKGEEGVSVQGSLLIVLLFAIGLFLGLALVVAGNGKMGLPVLAVLWLPVSAFLTLLLLRARRKRVSEILHMVFVLTIFIINILRLVR